jgi:hypothetical protein
VYKIGIAKIAFSLYRETQLFKTCLVVEISHYPVILTRRKHFIDHHFCWQLDLKDYLLWSAIVPVQILPEFIDKNRQGNGAFF